MKKIPEQLVVEFFNKVWTPPNDINAIDNIMTDDYEIITAGKSIKGRENFKNWVTDFQKVLINPKNDILDIFTNPEETMVVSRWRCSGINNGILGLPADQKQISFTGIAIWEVKNRKLSKCWVERSALELYQSYNL